MNIDYTAIIAKADARKDALLRFEAAVQQLSGHINEGDDPDLIEAFHTFQEAFNALDAEALALLPPNTGHSLSRWVANMLSTWAYVDKATGGLSCEPTPRNALYALAET